MGTPCTWDSLATMGAWSFGDGMHAAHLFANSTSTEPLSSCSQNCSLWRATNPGSPVVSTTVAPCPRAMLMARPIASFAP